MTSSDLTQGYISGPDAATKPRRQALVDVETADRIVLVEGVTDQIVIERLATRRGIDLVERGAVVAPMGGAHAIQTFLDVIDARTEWPRQVVGLCDEREAEVFGAADRASPSASWRFDVCRPDLEAELIRALTPARFEAVIEQHGDLAPLRVLQKQAPWRDRPAHEQMHRLLRSKARRMHTYAVAMVDALADDEIPAPLRNVVDALSDERVRR